MFQKQMFELLGMMLEMASPQVVEQMRKAVEKMRLDSKESENPWDHMLAMLLGIILGRPGAPIEGGELDGRGEATGWRN